MALARVVHPDYEVSGYGPSLDSAYANETYDGTYSDDGFAYPDWVPADLTAVLYGQPHGTASGTDYDGAGYDQTDPQGYGGPYNDPGPTPA